MRKFSLYCSGLFLVCFATYFGSCQTAAKNAGEGKLLQFNFEKGKTYDYEIISEMEMDIPGQGSLLTSSINGFSMQLTGIQDGIRAITVTYKRVAQKSVIAGTVQEHDTDKPDDDENNPLAMFSAMIGKSFYINVNAAGEVVELTGLDKIHAVVIDSSDLSEKQKQQSRAMLERMNGQAMKGFFEPIFGMYPNKEVKEGDSWQKSFVSAGFFGPGNSTATYTVKKIEGDLITLGVESNDKPMISAIGAVKKENSQATTRTGIMVVNSKTGLLLSSDLNSIMTIKIQGQDNKSTGKDRITGTIH